MKTFQFAADVTFAGVIVVDGTDEENARQRAYEGHYEPLDIDRMPIAVQVWGKGTEVK